MKLEIEIQDKISVVEWEQKGKNLTATINGTDYELILMSPSGSVYTVLLNNKVYEISIEPNPTNGTNLVKLFGKEISTKIVDRRKRAHKATDSASGTQIISAPMPGRVVQVLKNPGDEIKNGEGVVIVEAMKMQNELTSGKHGVIKAIKVKPGQTVAAGETLAIIE